MAVHFDIQGTQSPADAERGIGRYLRDLAIALQELPSRWVSHYVLDPGLAVPRRLEPLHTSGRLTYQDRLKPSTDDIYHIGYPLDTKVDLDIILPRLVRMHQLRITTTLFDLIPLLFPDNYLADARTRSRYSHRLELLRQADRVLAISNSAARDAVERLGLPPERVTVVGAGVSDRFREPDSRQAAYTRATAALPSLRSGFILVAAATDARKNIKRMVQAYALLPPELRLRHQLVIAGRLSPGAEPALTELAGGRGASELPLFTGFVSDELLTLLYQSCNVFVFPSLYEGFGLPAAEAQACGAPTLVADSSSLVEVVEERLARFDPFDIRSIRDVLTHFLSEPDRLERIRPHGAGGLWSWQGVAERSEAVFDELQASRRRRRTVPARVAFISPLPPQRSGIADYSARLLEHLSERQAVDAFTDAHSSEITPLSGVHVMNVSAFDLADRAIGGYRHVVYCIGNSDHHVETLSLLRERPGTVIAHDVRLTRLYEAACARAADRGGRDFGEVVGSMYGRDMFPRLAEDGSADFEELDRAGLLMAREVITSSEQFLVHSIHAAELARLEAPSGLEWKIRMVPFAAPPPREGDRPGSPRPIVATFGHAHPIKQHPKIVEAFRLVLDEHPDAILAIVGPIYETLERQLSYRARQLGMSDRVIITRGIDDRRYQRWLDVASIAVQLRAASNGESSASVNDCLAAGIPTVVTAIGSGRELSDSTVMKVDRDISEDDLGRVVSRLLDDRDLRARLSMGGRAYAREHSFAHTADVLLEKLRLVALGANRAA